MRPHLLHDIGMPVGDVVFLRGIAVEVIQFGIIYEPPSMPDNCGIAFARGSVPRWDSVAVLYDEHPIFQFFAFVQEAVRETPS